jgi:hypothetical protein
LAQSGHSDTLDQYPLSWVKRTLNTGLIPPLSLSLSAAAVVTKGSAKRLIFHVLIAREEEGNFS